MLFVVGFLLSTLALQTIHSTVSPTTLRAINAHRARVAADALRARSHLNTARARANLGLLDHRVIRNSDGQMGQDQDYGDEDLPYVEDYDGGDASDEILVFDEKHRGSAKELVAAGLGADMAGGISSGNCPFNNLPPRSNPDIDPHRFSMNFDSGREEGRVPDVVEAVQGGDSEHPFGNAALTPQRSLETGPPDQGSPGDSALGMTPQTFTTGQTAYGQQILMPMPFVPQGYPSMPGLTQPNAFAMPLPSPYPPQMIFLGQSPTEADNHEHTNAEISSFLRSDNASTVTAPHLDHSGHAHASLHTHSHFNRGKSGFQIPQAQVVTPAVNLHVIQNQNSAAAAFAGPSSQQFPTSRGRVVQIIPEGNIFSSSVIPTFTSTGGIVQRGQPFGYVISSPGMAIPQSQALKSATSTNDRYVAPPDVGGNSFSHQGEHAPSVGVERSEPMENQLNFQGSERDLRDAQVGSFLTDIRARAPESPESFDPNRSQNFQPIVNYIQRNGVKSKKVLRAMEAAGNLAQDFGTPGESAYLRAPKQFEVIENNIPPEDERLGTFPLKDVHMKPLPSLPSNFFELDPEGQQISLKQYWDQEQRNVKDFLEQVHESNRHHLEGLSSLIVPDSPNPLDFEDSLNEDDDLQAKSSLLNAKIDRELGDNSSNLGNIVNVPNNELGTDWFYRLARSLNGTESDNLDKLLLAEKAVINELKKDANHDEDLMMIGYIGENMIKDLEHRRNETKRSKREIRGISDLPLNRFMVHPTARLDIPKTLNNLGTAVRSTFEHEDAPMYHIRNMVGSAQDAMLATMKIPTNNLLIPSQYDIVKRQEDSALVGDINPNIFSEYYKQDQSGLDDVATTFHKVGSAIRGSVLSGQDALGHVGESANHAKDAVYSTKHVTPRLMLEQAPGASELMKKAILITPRILDIANQNEQLGNALGNSGGDFIKVGQILDAVGISNPDNNNLQFQKITMDPRGTVTMFTTPGRSRPSKMMQNFLKSVRVENFNGEQDEEKEVLGNTLSDLKNVRESFGASNLKDFLSKVKHNVENFFNETVHHSAEHKAQNTKPLPIDQNLSMWNDVGQERFRRQEDPNQEVVETSLIPDALGHPPMGLLSQEEIVTASLIPDALVRPFMGHVSQEEMQRLWDKAKTQGGDKQHGRLEHVLRAINPMIFEKVFNESIEAKDEDKKQDFFHSHSDEEFDDYDEDVGTNMKLSGMMLKPFMGQVTDKIKHDFFQKYMPEGGANVKWDEYKAGPPAKDWIDVYD